MLTKSVPNLKKIYVLLNYRTLCLKNYYVLLQFQQIIHTCLPSNELQKIFRTDVILIFNKVQREKATFCQFGSTAKYHLFQLQKVHIFYQVCLCLPISFLFETKLFFRFGILISTFIAF